MPKTCKWKQIQHGIYGDTWDVQCLDRLDHGLFVLTVKREFCPYCGHMIEIPKDSTQRREE
jgi:rRNA maturation endonuclease Nob1